MKGAALFCRGQYYYGILFPPGAVVFRNIIAPLFTGILMPPGIRGGSFITLHRFGSRFTMYVIKVNAVLEALNFDVNNTH